LASHLLRLAQAKRKKDSSTDDSEESDSNLSDNDEKNDIDEIENDPFRTPCAICESGYRCDTLPFATPDNPSCKHHVCHRK
jgi:hypothetical protein